MNFLAHFYLSSRIPSIEVGNFLGDFVKRKNWVDLPIGIQKGIILHHAIDEFTDTHKLVIKARQRLFSEYRHYSRVIIDLLYDYFLAKNFNNYSKEDLKTFSEDLYLRLNPYQELFPDQAKKVFQSMSKYNWLFHYQFYEDGFSRALMGLYKKSSGKRAFYSAAENIKKEIEEYELEFFLFFEELIKFAEKKLKSLT